MNKTRKNLRDAINRGNLNTVKSLLRTEQDKRIIFGDRTTPLMRAAQKANYNIIKYLVNELKVDKTVTDSEGKVALDYLTEAINKKQLSKNKLSNIFNQENEWGNLLDPKRSRMRKHMTRKNRN